MFSMTMANDHKLIVAGELTYAAVNAAVWEQSKQLIQQAKDGLTIDLQGVTHSDSTGVALLVAWLKLARQSHKTLHVEGVPSQMQAIMKVSGLAGFQTNF